MGKQFKKKHKEFCDETNKYDEALLRLLKQGHRELITKVIKDYLSLSE